MKILLVIDQFYGKNNGTTISTERFARHLVEHGNEVRIVTTGEPNENLYIVPERHVPIASKYAHNQGLLFAKPDKAVLTAAISWCDVVHFVIPFAISKTGVKIAKKLKKPFTAGFHIQAENITYNIGFGKSKFAINFIYALFRTRFYKNIEHIHCPSQFIASELRKHHYKGKLHIISNGINSAFLPKVQEKPAEYKDKFVITMVGRLSKEKRQDILINAVAKSKYADKIQLVFAGIGPKQKTYEKLSKKLPVKPSFGFYAQADLIKILQYSDLYVHPADVEIEAISCLEALACGLVPVISNSPASATKQFALDERSLFENGDCDNLAAKIDYWIEHEEEKRKQSAEYAKFAQGFNIDNCIIKMENMFNEAIEENTRK